MTKKLFHDDSYQTTFQATVLDKRIEKGRNGLILDQSCFYPNAGGQNCDKGIIEGIPVIDVQEVNSDIVHYMKDDIPVKQGDTITGEIDWKCRFDHMQQHSGQHILSGILIDLWQKETLSFHMGEEVCTIDISHTALDEKKVGHLEEMVNYIIYANKPIHQYYLEDNDNNIAKKLRKKQELHEKLRIIEIEKFDLTACGGTHCHYTGEVGIIKITGWENRKDKTRLSFLCGHRALADYQKKHQITKRLSSFFTTGVNQLEEKVAQLSKEQNDLTKSYDRIKKELDMLESEELKEKFSTEHEGCFVIRKLYSEKSLQSLRQIILFLINRNKCLVILGAEKPEPVICLACSQDFSIHMGELIKQIMNEYNGKGGGSNFMAMGKLKKSEDIPKAFSRALKLIVPQVQ